MSHPVNSTSHRVNIHAPTVVTHPSGGAYATCACGWRANHRTPTTPDTARAKADAHARNAPARDRREAAHRARRIR